MAFTPISTQAAIVSIAGLILYLVISKFRGRKSHPFPPGPPGEFLLGHLRVVPFEDAPTAYLNWGKEYSKLLIFFSDLDCTDRNIL
jgi:hypothetical protein